MKILLVVVGKVTTKYIEEGIRVYTDRLTHYLPFEIKTLADLKSTKGLTQLQQKQKEGEMILSAVRPGDFVILLDERGKELTSRGFSEMIDRRMASVSKNIIFVVGGPYGFSEEVYSRADSSLSLSKMTFSHEMVRLFFVEQLYRAMTILRGEPYHHD